MTISLAQTPTYPVPGRPVKGTITAGGGGNWARIWLTDAPPTSKFKAEIDKTQTTRHLIYEGDATDFEFRPDVGGRFTLITQEYTRGASTYGGGYDGDPNGYPTETKVGSEGSASIVVGTRLEVPIGAGADTAKLRLWVWDDTVRATSVAIHGEQTPALIKPSSTKAKTAIASANVVTALAALADVTASTMLGTLSDVVDDIITQLLAHELSLTYHYVDDRDNGPRLGYKGAGSPEGIIGAVQELGTQLTRHMTNDAAGSGVTAYHQDGGGNELADLTNLAVAKNAGDSSQALFALASLWAAYEAHRQNTSVHKVADSTNTLTALPKLLDLMRHFAVASQSGSPTAPATANGGAVLLVHSAGFREAS